MIKTKYAIYRDGKKISEFFKEALTAVMIGIDSGYFKIEGGATWIPEERLLKFYDARSLNLRYSIPKAPIKYEIRKITEEVWS